MNPSLPRRLHLVRARVALEDILRGSRPADQILESLFRSHKEMGKKDRASVSGLVYGVLRDLGRLQALAGDAPAAWLARQLADAGHATAEITALELPAPAADGPVPLHAARNLPADWHQRLLQQRGDSETAALAGALNRPAPVDVRVNSLKLSREAALAALHAAGIAATATALAPQGIRLLHRLSRQSPFLLDGRLEPQDEGSQLLALLVGAQPGETLIDWCAGAGGKSLALAAAMQNRGRVIACDISASRLARIAPRAARASVEIIETFTLSSPPPCGEGLAEGVAPLSRLKGIADAVLVDAPCSGTGTLRRAPELRLREFDFAALAAQQLAILTQAADAVRPGGRLIYATCSLFAEENEQVVDAFLATHPQFTPATAAAPFPLGLLDAQGRLRLWPQIQGCDGFFAACLQRGA